ncbi:MAG: hypothetical protein JSV40_04425 [Deltaproteobacteria bacterium]|nr:MAG: hypothetical protein JSV40_04425 [Deltaproteobacteria bacterium]
MGWDIFGPKGKTKEPQDVFHPVIERIEKVAPKGFRDERIMYYYNYRQMPTYRKPLLSLLKHISGRTWKEEDEELFLQELFRKLKDFYDVRGKLSIDEAIEDYSIKAKLLQIYKIFYDDTSLAGPKINECLEKIGKNQMFSKRGYNEN